MDQETTEASEVTGAPATETQGQATQEERYYTQQEFDDAMAKMKHSVINKALKPYQDLGDPEELRQLKQQAEEAKQKEQMERGEFENLLQDLASKKDAEIQKRDEVIKEYKVDTPLTNAAAKYRSVSPEQVKSLLKNNVRLSPEGEVEVMDEKGQVKYTESGTAYSVDDLVKEFLDTNPHFVQPTPSTSNSKNSYNNSKEPLDISQLDMSNPEHRRMYKEHRKK